LKESPKYPSALKTKIVTPQLDATREFYVTCLGMRVVEEWREENDVGCILGLAGAAREALLEIYEGSGSDDLQASASFPEQKLGPEVIPDLARIVVARRV
jgi:catechol 2,3-dioxygenase-like lactoylglutathione lyase family enzyme